MKRIHFIPVLDRNQSLSPLMAGLVMLLWLVSVGCPQDNPRQEGRGDHSEKLVVSAQPTEPGTSDSPEYLEIDREPGRSGGRLVVGIRAEPKTFNPVTAEGTISSRTVTRRLMASLVHLNNETRLPEPGLAHDWQISTDGRRFTLELRRGLHFSDGHPFNADDVLFTFRVHLDETVASGYRPLLISDGQPMVVRKLDSHRVEFRLANPFALGIQLLDTIGILPKHLLEKAYEEGRFQTMWGVDTPVQDIVGLGPYRLRRFVPGERVELERNPHYWKVDREGQRLPYLDNIILPIIATDESLVARFQKGEIDVANRLSNESFDRLENADDSELNLQDLGPGFFFQLLFFNLNDIDAKALPKLAAKQVWFRDPAFRHALSLMIDRDSIIRLVYGHRAQSMVSQVTPGNKAWLNAALEPPGRSPAKARELLAGAGYTWDQSNRLLDRSGRQVTFNIMTNSSSKQRLDIGTIIQDDLSQIGLDVKVLSIDYADLSARIFETFEYDAIILGLVEGMDPHEVTNIWPSGGSHHLWRLQRSTPEPAWQVEIDRLMQEQDTVMEYPVRKKLYDRVQEIIVEQEPCILLVSPNTLVGAKRRLGNFRPTILDHVTLWNIEELYWLPESSTDQL